MEKIAVLTHQRLISVTRNSMVRRGFHASQPEMNYTDRRGVCKISPAQDRLLPHGRLLEAYPAMTMAGSRREHPRDHFNHCVVRVNWRAGTYMLSTRTWPYGELREKRRSNSRIPGCARSSDLRLTPVSAPENHSQPHPHADNRLDEKGNADNSTITPRDSPTAISAAFTTGWQSDWQNTMEK